jgi:2-dehydro-3-deoxygluconokinase
MLYDLVALGETMIALAPPPGETIHSAVHLLVDHAGAESNTCVGLSRLGLRVAWVSRLGADHAGDRIHAALTGEGVDTRWVSRDPGRPTGLMLKEAGGSVRYYRTGSAASAMVTFLGSARGLRIVDPNLRLGLWGSDRRVELVAGP